MKLILDAGGVIVYPAFGQWRYGAAMLQSPISATLKSDAYERAHEACKHLMREDVRIDTEAEEYAMRLDYFAAMNEMVPWGLPRPQVEELASQVPLSLLLLTFPGSQKGQQVVQTVLATYRTRGWQQALDVLTCWYERGELPPGAAKPEQEDADRWERQQLYGLQQQLNKTPWVVVDNRPMPEVYEVRDLKYVLT